MNFMSFLLRGANLDFIQSNHPIMWPFIFSFPILFFLNNPHTSLESQCLTFRRTFSKKKHWRLEKSSTPERKAAESSLICSHAIIKVFKRISGNI